MILFIFLFLYSTLFTLSNFKNHSKTNFILTLLLLSMAPINFGYTKNVSNFITLDSMSFFLILLTMIIFLIVMTSEITNQNNLLFVPFSTLIYLLTGMSMMVFLLNKIIHFFIFFELSLIPIFILVMGWGYQPERQFASLMMLLYTLSASMPLFLLIIGMKSTSLTNFSTLNTLPMNNPMNFIMIIMMFTAFLVKFPIFLLHLWLPQAHVEAPLVGSMILAAILLKLGGFGMWKMFKLVLLSTSLLPKTILSLALMGGSVATLICIQQLDLKVIIAYSSVGHMGLCIASLMFYQSLSYQSIVIIFLAHGFTSSCLFLIAYNLYMFSNSRNILMNKGLLVTNPGLSSFLFITCLANMAGPPSFNLVGEILCSIIVIQNSFFNIIPIFMLMLFAVVVNLSLYTSIAQGQCSLKSTWVKSDFSKMISYLAHLWTLYFLTLVIFMV